MKHRMTLHPSPCGAQQIVVDEGGRVCAILFDSMPTRFPEARVDPGACAHVCTQLDEYWAGERQSFDLELALGGTPFQREVWRELQRIPYGETITYGQLAARIDRPRAERAVGQANGRNLISIVLPCHRVIGASGKLTGYAGGLPIKSQLLELEARYAKRAPHTLPLFSDRM